MVMFLLWPSLLPSQTKMKPNNQPWPGLGDGLEISAIKIDVTAILCKMNWGDGSQNGALPLKKPVSLPKNSCPLEVCLVTKDASEPSGPKAKIRTVLCR
jgi:hypothetical protein